MTTKDVAVPEIKVVKNRAVIELGQTKLSAHVSVLSQKSRKTCKTQPHNPGEDANPRCRVSTRPAAIAAKRGPPNLTVRGAGADLEHTPLTRPS